VKTSDAGIDFIIKHEGKYGKVYADLDSESNKRAGLVSYDEAKPHTNRGWATIGIGHLIYYVGSWNKDERDRFAMYLRDGDTMSEAQMIDLLKEDLAWIEKSVSKKLERDIPQESFDALISMAFNTGPNNANLLEAIRLTNEKKYQQAAEAMAGGPTTGSGSTKVLGGLVKRRKEESEKFLAGFSQNPLVGFLSSGPLTKPVFWITLLALGGISAWAYFNWDYVKEKLELE
jgi:GH24 family phage-related lysozyme (muramidase)